MIGLRQGYSTVIAQLATFTFRDDVPDAEIDALAEDLRAMQPACRRFGGTSAAAISACDRTECIFGVIALVDDQAGLGHPRTCRRTSSSCRGASRHCS